MSGLKDGECPKCGSQEIIDNAQLADKGHLNAATDAEVRLITRPNALFFKDPVVFKLQPYICGGCGYLESYVEGPDRLAAQSRKLKEATDQ
jgi:ribosomal protein S27AE